MRQRYGLTAGALIGAALVRIRPTVAKEIREIPLGYPSIQPQNLSFGLGQQLVDLHLRNPAITLIGVFVAGLLIGYLLKR